jgi:hypothetical protein
MKMSQFIKKHIFLIFALFGLFLIALSIALNVSSPSATIGIFGVWVTVSTAITGIIYGD